MGSLECFPCEYTELKSNVVANRQPVTIVADHVVWLSVGWSDRRTDRQMMILGRLSVCHTSEPCKYSCTDRDASWVEDLGGPGEPCIR